MFFRYPGSKKKLQIFVINELLKIQKDHVMYCEPFWGAGNIGMNCIEKLDLPIWINDLNSSLIDLWKSVCFNSDLLISTIHDYTPCVEDFFTFKKELETNVFDKRFGIIDAGFKKLACHQMSFGGCGETARGPIGGKDQKSPWKIDSRWSPKSMEQKILKLHNILKNLEVKFTSLDFREVLNCPDNLLVYLDPPYPSFKQNDKVYQHMFNEQDHIDLSNILKSTNHSWLLSNEYNDKILKLYEWANCKKLDINYSLSKKTKSELLVSNKF